jgi:O-antigen ligase
MALLASGSRGPVLGISFALLLLIVLVPGSREKRRRMLAILAAGAATFVLVPTVVPSSSVERATSILTASDEGLSSNGRTELWQKAWQQFVDHPFAGTGTGGFAKVEPVLLYPHNIVLEEAAELGVLGGVCVLALIALGLAAATRVYRASAGAERAEAALLLAMLVATIVNAMLSNGIEGAERMWLVLGLAYGMRERLRTAEALPARRDAGATIPPITGLARAHAPDARALPT